MRQLSDWSSVGSVRPGNCAKRRIRQRRPLNFDFSNSTITITITITINITIMAIPGALTGSLSRTPETVSPPDLMPSPPFVISPPPPVFPPASIWVLPDPLYTQNPQLYTHLTRDIQSKFGLTSSERLVLLAVLKNMPLGPSADRSAAATTLIDRILSLDPGNIKRLAEIFTNGLLDARSWGGTRKTVCSRAISRESIVNSVPNTAESRTENPVLDASYSDLFQHLGISPFPHQTAPVDGVSAERPPRRTAKHSRACLERQNSRCPLTTQSDIGLETAHLIPHSVAALKKSETPFWLLVAICLGSELRDRLYGIIRGADSYSTTNGLVLGCMMHKFFDKGVFYLIPRPASDFDTQTSRHLDVCFQWKYSPDNLSLCFTRLPADPEQQTHTTAGGSIEQSLAPQARQIQHGDVFRLFTDDPTRFPLPHPFLLSLHAVLWEMIGSAGLGETGHDKRKRLHRPAAQGDSDDSDDDANSKIRKRTKRGSRKDRKPKDKLQQKERPSAGAGPAAQPSPHLTASVNESDHPPYIPQTPVKEATQSMTFLEREYLNFKLRQVLAGDDDFDRESDGDTDDDEDDDDSSRTPSELTATEYQRHSGAVSSSSSGEYSSDDDSYGLDAEESEVDVGSRKVEPRRVECGFAERPPVGETVLEMAV